MICIASDLQAEANALPTDISDDAAERFAVLFLDLVDKLAEQQAGDSGEGS